jgi:hypothetical protein
MALIRRYRYYNTMQAESERRDVDVKVTRRHLALYFW